MLKSNLILLFTLTFFLMLSVTNATAATQNLATITNEEDSDLITLQLKTDENSDITHLKLIFKTKDNKVYDTDLYKAQTAADGIVLYKLDKRDIVKLKSPNFSTHQGGEIELDFLYNGITGSRDIKRLDLSRDGDKWSLRNDSKKVTKLHFVSNKKAIVGTIGIKRIDAK